MSMKIPYFSTPIEVTELEELLKTALNRKINQLILKKKISSEEEIFYLVELNYLQISNNTYPTNTKYNAEISIILYLDNSTYDMFVEKTISICRFFKVEDALQSFRNYAKHKNATIKKEKHNYSVTELLAIF